MRVIIYAAGVSRRLQSIVDNGLKGLLELNGKRIIEYQLNWIARQKVSEIVIVLGLEHELYREILGDCYQGIPIIYVYNPDYRSKGNMLSLWHAREYCDTEVLFTTSDLICNYDDIYKFINSSEENKILIDAKSENLFFNPDPVKVSVLDNKIINIQKQPDRLKTIDGIAIGVYKFSENGIQSIISSIEKKINTGNDDLSLYYAIDEVLENYNVTPVYADVCKWVDIDTLEDLDIAINLKL